MERQKLTRKQCYRQTIYLARPWILAAARILFRILRERGLQLLREQVDNLLPILDVRLSLRL